MPKILVFAACEKVILEEGTANISLISIFHELNIDMREEEMPKESAFPLRWSILSYWLREESDSPETEYEERYAIQLPSGTTVDLGQRSFKLSAETVRNISTIVGFPATAGKHWLRLTLRRDTEPEPSEIISFPVLVRFRSP